MLYFLFKPPFIIPLQSNTMQQAFSKFEKAALQRLSVIPTPLLQQLQSIPLNNAQQTNILRDIFRIVQRPVAQIELEVRINDLPKTPQQLSVEMQKSTIDMQRFITEVVKPIVSEVSSQLDKKQSNE